MIENCGHYYRGDGLEVKLPPPAQSCPKEIYDLMQECWQRDDTHRPNFREIFMFLQRKNMGYDPAHDMALMTDSYTEDSTSEFANSECS